MNSLIFLSTFEFFPNFLKILKKVSKKKLEAVTVKLLVQSPKKFSNDMESCYE